MEHDPEWAVRFEAEKALLEPVFGDAAPGGIHHVGSTAVPGLRAKPIIDILVGVTDLDSARGLISILAALNYHHAPYREDQMVWFCKPDPAARTHHLHLVPTDTRRFRDELAFRDALRSDPRLAVDYGELKRRLAVIHRDDREAYTEAKAAFIRAALQG